MTEDLLKDLAARPDVVRVAVSDIEGLVVAAVRGRAPASMPSDSDVDDDLWTASAAQFISSTTQHLKDLTLSRPKEMAIHGTADSLLFAWVSIGWLIARVSPGADWPRLWATVRKVQSEFATLTGGPA